MSRSRADTERIEALLREHEKRLIKIGREAAAAISAALVELAVQLADAAGAASDDAHADSMSMLAASLYVTVCGAARTGAALRRRATLVLFIDLLFEAHEEALAAAAAPRSRSLLGFFGDDVDDAPPPPTAAVPPLHLDAIPDSALSSWIAAKPRAASPASANTSPTLTPRDDAWWGSIPRAGDADSDAGSDAGDSDGACASTCELAAQRSARAWPEESLQLALHAAITASERLTPSRSGAIIFLDGLAQRVCKLVHRHSAMRKAAVRITWSRLVAALHAFGPDLDDAASRQRWRARHARVAERRRQRRAAPR